MGSAIELMVVTFTASEGGDHITDDRCLVTAAEDVENEFVATQWTVVCELKIGLKDTTFLVTTAKHGVDKTGIDGSISRSPNISNMDLTVTATEHPVDTTAVDDQIGVSVDIDSTDISCVGTTIKILNGVVAVINMNRGAIGSSQMSTWRVT